MVLADVENALFRDSSRGLEGGSFFLSTLLNRKDARCKKGKDAVDAMEEFYLLKSDARFCQYMIHKFNLDPNTDNTPPHLKTASSDMKSEYLSGLVALALKDLMPCFKSSEDVDPGLIDFPLGGGRRKSKVTNIKNKFLLNALSQDEEEHAVKPVLILEASDMLDEHLIEATVSQVQAPMNKVDYIAAHMKEISTGVSSSRSRKEFSCKICSYKSKLKTVCFSHVEVCLEKLEISGASEDEVCDNEIADDSLEEVSQSNSIRQETHENDENKDQYWRYKNCEFLIDSLFALATVYENYGDGLGMLIQCKVLLPVFHGLKHSNYSCSIHRLVTRILCDSSPKEALKIIHERFFNRTGKAGGNIFKDRRMEHRIGTLKKLISNLGPNFDQEHVQQVNKTVEIKELLFHETRRSHEVNIRSGRHVPRSDLADYQLVFKCLEDTEAHLKKPGRQFGNFDLPEDLLTDDRFDQAEFYRWLTGENEEAKSVMEANRIRKARLLDQHDGHSEAGDHGDRIDEQSDGSGEGGHHPQVSH